MNDIISWMLVILGTVNITFFCVLVTPFNLIAAILCFGVAYLRYKLRNK